MSAPSATCPVADRCGGCPLLGLSGEEQGRRKVMRVREELAASPHVGDIQTGHPDAGGEGLTLAVLRR